MKTIRAEKEGEAPSELDDEECVATDQIRTETFIYSSEDSSKSEVSGTGGSPVKVRPPIPKAAAVVIQESGESPARSGKKPMLNVSVGKAVIQTAEKYKNKQLGGGDADNSKLEIKASDQSAESSFVTENEVVAEKEDIAPIIKRQSTKKATAEAEPVAKKESLKKAPSKPNSNLLLKKESSKLK